MLKRTLAIVLFIIFIVLWQQSIPLMGLGKPPFWLDQTVNNSSSGQINAILVPMALAAMLSMGIGLFLLTGKAIKSTLITIPLTMALSVLAFIVAFVIYF